jgi:hypothetical protein
MLIRCELHAHSNLSDGLDSVEELLQEAVKRGIQAISITDHDTLDGTLRALEIVERVEMPLIIIPGYELSAKEGHLLVFGEEKNLKIMEKGIEIKEAAEELKKKNCITVLAHPYQFYRDGTPSPSKVVSWVDAVEVFNSRSVLSFFNNLAFNLAKKHGKSCVAGSDAHSKEGIGFGVTIVDTELSAKKVLQEIKDGKTKINSKMFPFMKILKEGITKKTKKRI